MHFLVTEIENILLLKLGRRKNAFPCFIEHYSGHPNNNGIKMQRVYEFECNICQAGNISICFKTDKFANLIINKGI